MKLEQNKSYFVYIKAEPIPDGEDFFPATIKYIKVLEKNVEAIKKQGFDHLLEPNWYHVFNLETNKEHWYCYDESHIVKELTKVVK